MRAGVAETFDIVVIGGGVSGGHPAATYLQKAGLRVLIVGTNSELGTFCCRHEGFNPTWVEASTKATHG